MYFLLTRKCRIAPCSPHLPLPQWALHLATAAQRIELKVASKRGVANAVLVFVLCWECVCECVCIFYARLRFCMQINQRRPVTCRIWALAEASARVRRGGRFGDGRNRRLAAVRKNISHTICHTRYILCPVAAKGWQTVTSKVWEKRVYATKECLKWAIMKWTYWCNNVNSQLQSRASSNRAFPTRLFVFVFILK